MKKVYVARNSLEAHFVKGLLEAEGIEAFVRGEYIFGGRGELPMTPETCPSVWIFDDESIERAAEIAAAYARGKSPAVATRRAWRCQQCSEWLQPQFTGCWKCGATRPAKT